MPIYTYICTGCGEKSERLVKRAADADSQECALCRVELVRDEIADLGTVVVVADKAYRPAFKMPDGKPRPTPGAHRKGLNWF